MFSRVSHAAQTRLFSILHSTARLHDDTRALDDLRRDTPPARTFIHVGYIFFLSFPSLNTPAFTLSLRVLCTSLPRVCPKRAASVASATARGSNVMTLAFFLQGTGVWEIHPPFQPSPPDIPFTFAERPHQNHIGFLSPSRHRIAAFSLAFPGHILVYTTRSCLSAVPYYFFHPTNGTIFALRRLKKSILGFR